jgi:hypothetical protein
LLMISFFRQTLVYRKPGEESRRPE